MNKQETRDVFRSRVLDRDKCACAMCGYKPEDPSQLDAHHICDRHDMPFGGYVAANGITLCTDRCNLGKPWEPYLSDNYVDCHQKAETLHATGQLVPGYTPTDLYARIKSNYKWAYKQSLLLGLPHAQVELMMQRIAAISTEELEICLELTEISNLATWELACDKLDEDHPFIRAYGKGRYVSDF